jgi:hypothetical protein
MEANLGGLGTRRHIMSAAEGGKEVVEGLFVRQIDQRESQTDLVSLRFEMKQVVIADARFPAMILV